MRSSYDIFKRKLGDNPSKLQVDTCLGLDIQLFGTAAAAKLIATTLTYPHEVVRTRMRERTEGKEYATLISSFKNLYKQSGCRGLYAGYEAHVLRTVPNAAIMFMIVEVILQKSLQSMFVGNQIPRIKRDLRSGESNPGRPRDRRKYLTTILLRIY